jgi:hypothetical protein
MSKNIDKELYKQRAIKLALDLCPSMYPCKKCGSPVVKGYCCTFCGDTNPSKENNCMIIKDGNIGFTNGNLE